MMNRRSRTRRRSLRLPSRREIRFTWFTTPDGIRDTTSGSARNASRRTSPIAKTPRRANPNETAVDHQVPALVHQRQRPLQKPPSESVATPRATSPQLPQPDQPQSLQALPAPPNGTNLQHPLHPVPVTTAAQLPAEVTLPHRAVEPPTTPTSRPSRSPPTTTPATTRKTRTRSP